MVGFRCEWAAQNNIVGVLKQVRKCAPNRSPKGLCVGSWATIVIEDCHPKAMRPFGNFLTNAAQSNNAYRCPVNFTPQHVARIIGGKVGASRVPITLNQPTTGR